SASGSASSLAAWYTAADCSPSLSVNATRWRSTTLGEESGPAATTAAAQPVCALNPKAAGVRALIVRPLTSSPQAFRRSPGESERSLPPQWDEMQIRPSFQ